MLEKLNLERKLAGDEFKRILPGMQRRLYDLEKACWDNGVSSLVVFEGGTRRARVGRFRC